MRFPTPFQTVGPFFSLLLSSERYCALLRKEQTPGQAVSVKGTIHDGVGQPVTDALIEIWQANSSGCCNHPEDPRTKEPNGTFGGFDRAHTDDRGSFVVETIKPGRVPGPNGKMQAPHLLLSLFARGLLTRLVTRIYFDDESSNTDDPILALVTPNRRPTLIATSVVPGSYRFEVVLQGPGETVFFNV